jgi:rhodanese-related sulfurtransferase
MNQEIHLQLSHSLLDASVCGMEINMGFQVIHPGEIEEIIGREAAIVVDVREREAYRTYHYRGAYNYPYEDMEKWIRRLSKRYSLILYCEHGSTSLLAARRLAKEGYRVYAVAGGIHAIRQYFHD